MPRHFLIGKPGLFPVPKSWKNGVFVEKGANITCARSTLVPTDLAIFMGRKKLTPTPKRCPASKALIQKCYERSWKLPPKDLLDQFDFYYYGKQGALGSDGSHLLEPQLERAPSTPPPALSTLLCRECNNEMTKIKRNQVKVWACLDCDPFAPYK